MTAAPGAVLAILLGVGALGVGVAGLLGHTATLALPALVPLGGLELSLDPLAGAFLTIVGAVGIPAAVAAAGTRGQGLALNACVVAMAIVPLAANAVTLLLAWELMALAGYFLLLERAVPTAEDEESAPDAPEAVRAAWTYALLTHAALGCVLAGALLVAAATGSVRFADWRAAAAGLSPEARLGAFALLALGFGSAAAAMPLHGWLPRALPAAPPPAAALLSGAAVALGLYGLIRCALDWLAPAPPSWGVALLLVGALSAVAGSARAAAQRDLARVIAFSAIASAGTTLAALGAAVAFRAAGLPALAALSLAAGLYHALNRGAFQALLALAAGALAHGAGTRDLDYMGGLIKRMPWTAACFLLGAVAAAALPPLNGFASAWLVFQALLQSPAISAPGVKLAFAAALASLALAAGLAVAGFVRAAGTALLAEPRAAGAAMARETPWPPRAAMLALALACLGLGIGQGLAVPPLARAAAGLVGVLEPGLGDALAVSLPGDVARLSAPAVALAIAAAVAVPTILLARRARGRRIGETWRGGRGPQGGRADSTATAFADPFTRALDRLWRPRPVVDVETHPESSLLVRRIRHRRAARAAGTGPTLRALGAAVRALLERGDALAGRLDVSLVSILIALLVLLALA